MRYRAQVIPLFEGHRQEDKTTWEYTDAESIPQAGRFLRIRFPYPKYVVEEPMADPREVVAKGNPIRKDCRVLANKLFNDLLEQVIECEYSEVRYVTITGPGKTVLHTGDVVSLEAFEKENERVRKLGEQPAEGV